MDVMIGIRREDKNQWERRAPLTPADLADLQGVPGLRFVVQPSSIRIYPDEEYRKAGATLSEDLGAASIILAVKEIPIPLLQAGKTYLFFAHVMKGQPHNMPMLKRLMELGCTLVDYERIADERNFRLIFFGRQAGQAGMVETLRALGQRLLAEGVRMPLAQVRQAYEYEGLPAAKEHLGAVGREIGKTGLPGELRPLVVGFAGYGNVSKGAQEILDCLPVREVSVADLPRAAQPVRPGVGEILKVVFKEEDLVRPRDAGTRFQLEDYYRNPERYVGCFEEHLPFLDILVNAIYWDSHYPRLVTREWARRAYRAELRPRLKVIGDISCDIHGSIELTFKATEPDRPCYVYDPYEDGIVTGVTGRGPTLMAVDNLPCEFPRESSEFFSSRLKEMIRDSARAHWEVDFERLDLPAHLKKAVIVHKGKLTPSYEYLRQYLAT